MNINHAFSTMRMKYGVTSLEMAKKTNGTHSIRSLQNFMAKGANPKIENIILCCDLIGCKVSELMLEAERY